MVRSQRKVSRSRRQRKTYRSGRGKAYRSGRGKAYQGKRSRKRTRKRRSLRSKGYQVGGSEGAFDILGYMPATRVKSLEGISRPVPEILGEVFIIDGTEELTTTLSLTKGNEQYRGKYISYNKKLHKMDGYWVITTIIPKLGPSYYFSGNRNRFQFGVEIRQPRTNYSIKIYFKNNENREKFIIFCREAGVKDDVG